MALVRLGSKESGGGGATGGGRGGAKSAFWSCASDVPTLKWGSRR